MIVQILMENSVSKYKDCGNKPKPLSQTSKNQPNSRIMNI
jgi:hypothetical protein